MDKTALRHQLRLQRRALVGRAERSRLAIQRLKTLPFWASARCVLVYANLGAELETQSLLTDTEKICVVPYCLPGGELGRFRLENREELQPGMFGILEPAVELRQKPERTVPLEELDAVVLPGVGFDADGFRLGQGGGYYDRLLEKLSPKTRTVGLAFACQMVERLPHEAHDLPVDYVVTEDSVRRFIPKTVGILGGIACGKSLVSDFLETHGAAVFHADTVGHEALQDPEIQCTLAARWGEEVASSRAAIAAKVFSQKAELEFLNKTVHPWILTQWKRFCLTHRHAPLWVLDAPLLLEAGWGSLCDERLFVDTPLAMRQRFAAERGWTADELERRERTQLSLDEKRAAATYVLPNSGTAEHLREALETLLPKLERYS